MFTKVAGIARTCAASRRARNPKLAIALGAIVVGMALHGHAGAPYVDPADDAQHFGPPTRFLFWTPKQKVAGFRNIASIFATRTIQAGDEVLPLPAARRQVRRLTYRVDGTAFDLDDFMDYNHVVGLIALKDGVVRLERYAAGNDENSLWVSFSVAKSVVSMLVGAAIADGYIASVDEPVTDYLPRLKGSAYDETSIRDLLQMASGVAWNEDYADPESDVNNLPPNLVDLYRRLGAKLRVAAAGEAFNYNTAETNLVGALLRAAIGNNLATYLEHKMWLPFGMQADANWMTHGVGGGELGGCCISATLRDYARIGLFALADGVLADGTRVLPEGWMRSSTEPSRAFPGYGYLWWLEDGPYSALGIFGQTIFVDPVRNVVIVTHSVWPTAVGDAFYQHRRAFTNALAKRLAGR